MPLKVLILCAGYGTRLEQDLKNATKTSKQYSHLVGIPKPLLPIGDQPLITHWINQIREKSGVDGVYIVTNDTNKRMFEEWKNGLESSHCKSTIQIFSDGTTTNEGRLGAIACIQLIVEHFEVEKSGHDLVVIGGDTLFHEDVKLSNIIISFHQFKTSDHTANMVLGCPCAESNVHKRGILEVSSENKVLNFLEKPLPQETSSRIQCPCFYILCNKSLNLLKKFLVEKKDQPLQARDAPGNFIRYLIERAPVFCKQVSGRFDVGGLESYLDCCSYFGKEAKLS